MNRPSSSRSSGVRTAGLGLTTASFVMLLGWPQLSMPAGAADPPHPPATGQEDLTVAVAKKGLGKEVTIRKGPREWYLLIEVTSDNTVVVRQEKNGEAYIVDESETHDRSLTPGEVDTAVDDFINSVKTQVKKGK
jgi:hypothetical protein